MTRTTQGRGADGQVLREVRGLEEGAADHPRHPDEHRRLSGRGRDRDGARRGVFRPRLYAGARVRHNLRHLPRRDGGPARGGLAATRSRRAARTVRVRASTSSPSCELVVDLLVLAAEIGGVSSRCNSYRRRLPLVGLPGRLRLALLWVGTFTVVEQATACSASSRCLHRRGFDDAPAWHEVPAGFNPSLPPKDRAILVTAVAEHPRRDHQPVSHLLLFVRRRSRTNGRRRIWG